MITNSLIKQRYNNIYHVSTLNPNNHTEKDAASSPVRVESSR